MNNSLEDPYVWIRGRITELATAPEGQLLYLLIVTAKVSVLAADDENRPDQWEAGMEIDIHIGPYDAWVRPRGANCPLVACGILYVDQHSATAYR